MKKIINKKIVSVCVVLMLTLSCIIPVWADDTAAALTEDDLEQFYTYTDVGDGTWQVGLTAAFKAQVNSAKGGTYTVDGYTWTTGDPLPNPAPGGMHKGKAVTSMGDMFQRDKNLTSLDLSSFDTSNVTNMSFMFEGCSSLNSLDISNFNTSSVTDLYSMFETCKNLTSLDVSSFDTSSVTTMGCMFYVCEKLTSLDVSRFDTSKVTNMEEMFEKCSSLTSLDLSSFDTSKVTNMTDMFKDCGKAASGTPATGYAGSVAAADSFNAGDGTNGINTGNLKFVYKKVEYIVSFEPAEGSAVADEKILEGDKATKPADPTRNGYNFQGWYTDETYASEYDFSNGVTGDLTLYAKWEKTASTDTKSDIKGNDHDNNSNDNNAKKASTNSDFPYTGDQSDLMMWIMLAIIGVAATGVTILYRKFK